MPIGRRGFLLSFLTGLVTGTVWGADWPQWRGPRQDGVSTETGLAAQWPAGGPPELWRVPLGLGFAAVSVVGPRAFTLCGDAGGEYAVALDVASGKTVWKTRCGELFKKSDGDGPRATPLVESGRCYGLTGKGTLVCLDASDGRQQWSVDLLAKFGGEAPEYGFSASPVLIDGQLVVVVGAGKGKSLAAFDKSSGAVLWTSLDDKPGYSTPIRVEVDGVPQLIVLMGEALVSVSPKDGREYWRYPWKTTQDANVATPIFQDKRLFISTGYGTGCGMFALAVKDGKPAADLLWANKDMKNAFSSCVLVDGHLYGFNDRFLACLDFRTGAAKWKQRGFNRGTVLAADGKLIVYGERATLALAALSSAEYKELAKAQVLDDKTWTVPTLSAGRLFVRNEKDLVCLKVTP